MENEKLKSWISVMVKETEDEVHTQVQGLIDPNASTTDKAEIALHVIKSLDINVMDVVICYCQKREDVQ